jgi:two-component system, LuxR family, response regulator FixJ
MAVVAMRNGAVDFIEKPFDKENLVERVRRSLDAVSPTAAPRVAYPSPDSATRLSTLTVREREVYDEMITGKTSKLIARDLGGSFRTIEIHRARVMAKMAASTLAELVRMSFDAEPL